MYVCRVQATKQSSLWLVYLSSYLAMSMSSDAPGSFSMPPPYVIYPWPPWVVRVFEREDVEDWEIYGVEELDRDQQADMQTNKQKGGRQTDRYADRQAWSRMAWARARMARAYADSKGKGKDGKGKGKDGKGKGKGGKGKKGKGKGGQDEHQWADANGKQICFAWNSIRGCTLGHECTRSHVCSNGTCGGSHTKLKCPNH
jgi:hypothetical protein